MQKHRRKVKGIGMIQEDGLNLNNDLYYTMNKLGQMIFCTRREYYKKKLHRARYITCNMCVYQQIIYDDDHSKVYTLCLKRKTLYDNYHSPGCRNYKRCN